MRRAPLLPCAGFALGALLCILLLGQGIRVPTIGELVDGIQTGVFTPELGLEAEGPGPAVLVDARPAPKRPSLTGRTGPDAVADVGNPLHDLTDLVHELEGTLASPYPPLTLTPALSELSAAQRGRVVRIVDAARTRLDDLRARPDDSGQTWSEAEAGGHGLEFGAATVPGTSETYVAAAERIRADAVADARALVPESSRDLVGTLASLALRSGIDVFEGEASVPDSRLLHIRVLRRT